jgi:hypothetical protein
MWGLCLLAAGLLNRRVRGDAEGAEKNTPIRAGTPVPGMLRVNWFAALSLQPGRQSQVRSNFSAVSASLRTLRFNNPAAVSSGRTRSSPIQPDGAALTGPPLTSSVIQQIS